MSSLGLKFFGTASQPFFITAGMLQPPWADPMAIWDFQNFLVGMGLKTGSVQNPADVKGIAEMIKEAGKKAKGAITNGIKGLKEFAMGSGVSSAEGISSDLAHTATTAAAEGVAASAAPAAPAIDTPAPVAVTATEITLAIETLPKGLNPAG